MGVVVDGTSWFYFDVVFGNIIIIIIVSNQRSIKYIQNIVQEFAQMALHILFKEGEYKSQLNKQKF